MKILILSGHQGAGKTTAGSHISTRWLNREGHWHVTHMKFADVLYWIHNQALDILEEHLPADILEKRKDLVKDGPLLQLLGTEWGRKTIDEDIWVKILRNRVNKISLQYPESFNHLVIIDDCRFENEFDEFPEALRVRLRAEEGCRKKRCSMWRENTNHPSETGLDSYAVAGKFDLYLNTDDVDIDGCVSLIMAQLDKDCWVEKRKT